MSQVAAPVHPVITIVFPVSVGRSPNSVFSAVASKSVYETFTCGDEPPKVLLAFVKRMLVTFNLYPDAPYIPILLISDAIVVVVCRNSQSLAKSVKSQATDLLPK